MMMQTLAIESPQSNRGIQQILIPDIMLAVQMPARENHLQNPGARFFCAILDDAIMCLQKGLKLGMPATQGRGPRPRGPADPFKKDRIWRNAKDAFLWLMTDTSHLPKKTLESYVSIEQCCAATGIDINYLRSVIRKVLHQTGKENFFNHPIAYGLRNSNNREVGK